jgi:D-alanine-D-alanine ligase
MSSGGGSSAQREISLLSSENVYEECHKIFPTMKIILTKDALPYEAIYKHTVIFPVLHGKFMEDGGLQAALEAAGLAFVGSDSKASKLCMDKSLTKQVVAKAGIPVVEGIKFTMSNVQSADSIVSSLGSNLFMKPNANGSRIDTHVVSSKKELEQIMCRLDRDIEYILKRRIDGKNLAVAMLEGRALEVVDISRKYGFLDYMNKYTPGYSNRIGPSTIPEDTKSMVKQYCEDAFRCCGCRDWARIYLML